MVVTERGRRFLRDVAVVLVAALIYDLLGTFLPDLKERAADAVMRRALAHIEGGRNIL